LRGEAATEDDDRALPIRTAACIGIGVPETRYRAQRTGMSIPKKGSKSAKSASKESERLKDSVAPKSTSSNPRVTTVIEFMEANLDRKISLSEMAGVANLSRSHLSHLFKTQTGLSPGEYVRRLRMDKATHLLATTLLSIKQIMAITGYGNRSDFLRHFKRYYEVTPTEYRNRAYIAKRRQTNRENT